MNNTTRSFIKDLLYENDSLSLTRLLSILGYLLFAFCSIYLMMSGTNWPDYTVFASYTGGGGAALQFANKYINSKYNTNSGSFDPKNITTNSQVCPTSPTVSTTSPEINRVNKPFIDKK